MLRFFLGLLLRLDEGSSHFLDSCDLLICILGHHQHHILLHLDSLLKLSHHVPVRACKSLVELSLALTQFALKVAYLSLKVSKSSNKLLGDA
jgi:hypothetical protein